MNKNQIKQNAYILAIATLSLVFVQCNDKVTEQIMENMARSINSKAPTNIAEGVTIDSCRIVAPDTLKMYYTTQAYYAEQFAAGEYEKLNKSRAILELKNKTELKIATDRGIIFSYVYFDRNGKLIGEITLTAGDYNKTIEDINKDAEADSKFRREMYKREVEAMKRDLPEQSMNDIDMLDCYIDNNQMITYVSIIKIMDINKIDTTEFKKDNEYTITQALATDIKSKDALKVGMGYRFIYLDKNKNRICNIDITEDHLPLLDFLAK